MNRKLALLAMLLAASCKGRDYAAEEAAEAARSRARAAEKLAKQRAEQDDLARETAAGSAACSKIANDTRACNALDPSEREHAEVCAKVDMTEVRACARHKARMGE